jgi:membrane protease YdiL (CAAX protease family)
MALWLLAYLFLGRVFVPLLAALGLPLQAHPSAGAGGGGVALAHLALDAAQLGCTCLILRLSLGEPWRALRSKGLFSFGWRNAREWIPAVLIGCLAFPIVGWAARWAAAVGLDAAASAPPLPIEGDAVGAGGSLVLEAGAAAAAAPGGGGAAAAAALGYALVVAVCAPLWEEAVFRGFLLPSVAAYGPFFGGGGGDGKAAAEEQRGQSSTTATAASLRAVVLSAAAFAGCHFRADTALPMFLLGLLFGGACVATRGRLAAPVALHGLWNLWAVAHSAVAA